MDIAFYIIAAVTLIGAIAAMSLRNLVHCALSLVVAFAGLAAFFLKLGAQFVGLVQILIYVGAVAILIVFAVLLTRGGSERETRLFSSSWIAGIVTAAVVFGTLVACVVTSPSVRQPIPPAPELTVQRIGEELMTQYVLPLQIIGLLLTAAMIGAAVIAMKDPTGRDSRSKQEKEHEPTLSK
jgi:NADH:ubiquinone oxidoreductase subunit 6 (subunit J)